MTGLAGTARDIAALTNDGAHIYTMAGAMGGACMIGLGLALARPRQAGAGRDRRRRTADEYRRAGDDRGAQPGQPRRSCASTTAITAKPAIRRATPASASISKRSPSGSGIKRTRTVASEADFADGAPPPARGQRHRLRVAESQAGRSAALQAQPRPGLLPHPLPGRVARRRLIRSGAVVPDARDLWQEMPAMRRPRPSARRMPAALPYDPASWATVHVRL